MKKRYIIPIFIPNSGCRYRCIYCNQPFQTGVETFSPSGIDEIIRQYLGIKDNWDEVAFYGGTFCGLDLDMQSELLGLTGKYLEKGNIKGIRFSTSPELISETNIKFYKKKGVTTIEIGAQSMNDEILAFCGRNHTSHDVITSSILVKRNGIVLGIQFMTGLPLENSDKLIKTVNSILKIKPDFVRIYPLLVFKDTALFQMYKDGTYSPESLEDAVSKCSRIVSLFKENGVEIVRTGIQLSDLSRLAAGPYHPSFGYLVHSRLFRNKLEEEISRQDFSNKKRVYALHINKRDLPLFYGYKGENKEYFKSKYPEMQIQPSVNKNIEKGCMLIGYEKI